MYEVMSGAEMKVRLTGLGLTPGWLAEQIGVTMRTVLRWFEEDVVPARAAAAVGTISEITDSEVAKMTQIGRMSGVIHTRRTDAGVAERNTLTATWQRHATFRALNNLRHQGVPVKVEYVNA